MNALDIITKKRNGEKLCREEIDYFIHGYAANRLPDYQMAALLMAVFFQGMDFEETAGLTNSMLHSGDILNFKNVDGFKIDKHSTGGVGDKVSLILAPLVAAAGLKVPMISGRGLGHSGGTLDKLESIPGFRTNLSVEEFYRQICDLGVSMIGQTEMIVPADRKMYALRDATATIESIPLITGSILSKKLAEGIDGLVLDVKTGRGAFMQNFKDAETLATSLIRTAELNGLPTTALITNMDQPLGNTAGNWLETREAIEALHGNGPEDLVDVTFALAAQMLVMAGFAANVDQARKELQKLIINGKAFQKFCDMVQAQGGDLAFIDEPEKYPPSKIILPVLSEQEGYVQKLDARKIGFAVVHLGGGREVMEDRIDYAAGVVLYKKIGDFVRENEVLAELHTDRRDTVETIRKDVLSAFEIGEERMQKPELIFRVLKKSES
ncbi:MAG: thymidine phosphorylase [Calditrichaeota bacterium]|nr:thymidine phosphorylase [Calditrichota bacterium]